MSIKPIKKKSIQKESDFDKRWQDRENTRIEKEKEADEKKISAEKELVRKHELITNYLNNLESKIYEDKQGAGFWTFPDRTGFKRIYKSTNSIEKILNKDPKKYNGRSIVEYSILFHQNEKPNSMSRNAGLWLNVTIRSYTIKKVNNRLMLKLGNQCDIAWTTNDFAISKFSFKLIERFMEPIVYGKMLCVSILGKSLRYVLDRYKKETNVDFSDVLQPMKTL